MSGALAVAIHDIEPRSFARIRQIRDWLLERRVRQTTLLVIPAADLHPIGSRSPALSAWLRGRVAAGDVVAQHGLAHRATNAAPWPRSVLASFQGGPAAEFPGLGADDARRRVQAGLRLLHDIGLAPRGFVAPGYAYTRALRSVLRDSFEWSADLRAVRAVGASQPEPVRSPALCLGSSTALKRALSPALVSAAARSCGPLMRVDVHPADFDLPRHRATLEALLTRADGRKVVTYDELLG